VARHFSGKAEDSRAPAFRAVRLLHGYRSASSQRLIGLAAIARGAPAVFQ
jgi:hypothetical protein